MTPDSSAATPPDPADVADIWRSELAALAVDRESQEGFAAGAMAWALALERLRGDDAAGGRAGPDAPPRPEAARADNGARRDEIERLRARIGELERGQ